MPADVELAGDHVQARDVVAVLVGYQDGVDAGELLAGGGEPLADLASAQPGVHQQPRAPAEMSVELPELPLASTQTLTMTGLPWRSFVVAHNSHARCRRARVGIRLE